MIYYNCIFNRNYYKKEMTHHQTSLDKMASVVSLVREDILKGCQYAAIFITWLHERNQNPSQMRQWFSLYQKLFHSRRLFRVMSFIVYGPRIRDLFKDLKESVSLREVFELLGHAFVSLFLLFDNASVIMMMIGNQSYRMVRRISYSIFLFGIIWQIISYVIKLRESFKQESDLKKQLEEMTPVQFLERINDIDEDRKIIAIEFINLVGDFVPALARTNMPEIVVRTKVNKGTVGFFGMVASLAGILLKMKRWEKYQFQMRELR